MKEDTLKQFFDALITDKEERNLLSLLSEDLEDEKVLQEFFQVLEKGDK